MIPKTPNELYSKTNRPYYDGRHRVWKVDIPDWGTEEGSLLYVAGEFARTSLVYPFNTSETMGKEYSDHEHSFNGVIENLLIDPKGFSIEGFEDYYSRQEIEMLTAIQKKILEHEECK